MPLIIFFRKLKVKKYVDNCRDPLPYSAVA